MCACNRDVYIEYFAMSILYNHIFETIRQMYIQIMQILKPFLHSAIWQKKYFNILTAVNNALCQNQNNVCVSIEYSVNNQRLVFPTLVINHLPLWFNSYTRNSKLLVITAIYQANIKLFLNFVWWYKLQEYT